MWWQSRVSIVGRIYPIQMIIEDTGNVSTSDTKPINHNHSYKHLLISLILYPSFHSKILIACYMPGTIGHWRDGSLSSSSRILWSNVRDCKNKARNACMPTHTTHTCTCV